MGCLVYSGWRLFTRELWILSGSFGFTRERLVVVRFVLIPVGAFVRS